MASTRESKAEAFDDPDVARCYAYRPAYPSALFDHLLSLTSGRRRALDLGCGSGKVTRVLAEHFGSVDAVDPSGPMLDVARSENPSPRVRWIAAKAEDLELRDEYDLVAAGTSIHWMRHDVLFRKLAGHLARDGFVAIAEGDRPHRPPWKREWETFITRWLNRLGERYSEIQFDENLRAFERWMHVRGRHTFLAPVRQPVDHYVECQHSRSTFTRSRMGHRWSDEFDEELRCLLSPYATDGEVSFEVKTDLTWGLPIAGLDYSEA